MALGEKSDEKSGYLSRKVQFVLQKLKRVVYRLMNLTHCYSVLWDSEWFIVEVLL
jgi:hypothetical protein